jgi:dihydrodipicolinate synthase/N-acetylneuraminate lyase
MKLSRLRELAGSELKVFGASHGRSYLWELERGAVGIMTASPIPEYLIAIWRAFQRGELKKARELFFYSLPLAHFYGEIALAIKKEVLVSRGVIETANMKQPSSELREADRKALLELVHWMETNIERSSGIPPFRWTQPEMSR